MRSLRLCSLLFILAVAFTIGCSSYEGGPVDVNPYVDTEIPRTVDNDGHSVMAIYSIDIDIESNSVEVIRNRDSEPHWNVTSFLLPPNCNNCFTAAILNYDPVAKTVNVRVTLKNPTNLTGYDVRGIILDFGYMKLTNPDSYTKLFGPGAINPFIAWITNADRSFPALQVHYEEISIYNPAYPKFPAFTFVVDASWPNHCKEPYEVHPFDVTGDLQSDGSNSLLINCTAYDWQDNIESVTIDLTPIGGMFGVPMNDMGGNLYQTNITYVSGPGQGYYDLLITATTSDPVAYNQTYNYVTIHVVGPGTEFPIEFGKEERVSFTPGASFMWPKHAIATDSEGLPHIVWSDNDPDPYSNKFGLYYSYRNPSGIWQEPQIVGSSEVDAVYATICIDDDDVVHVIWEDQRAGQLASDIYYASSKFGFTGEVPLTSAEPGVRYAFPRCVYYNELLHLVWHDNHLDPEGDDYGVYYMTYNPDTGTPGSVITVEDQPDIYEGFPSIDVDLEGNIHVAYQQENETMQIYHKKKTGDSFGAASLVAGTDAYQPSINCGNNPNNVFVAYFDYSDATFCDVYLGMSTNGGMNFTTQKVSSDNAEYQVHPDVVQSQLGDIYVIWASEGYIDQDGTPGPDDLNGDEKIDENDAVPHLIYFRQRMGLAWQVPLTLTGDNGAAAFPQLALGTEHFVHAAYMKWTLDNPYNNYEIYYRRSLPFG